MRHGLARAVFGTLLGLSLVAFLSPGGETPPPGPDDKVVHLLTFAVLAGSGRWARVAPVRLGTGLAAYAALTEVLQAVLPIGRRGDLRDLLADVLGIGLGLLVSAVAIRVSRRRAPR